MFTAGFEKAARQTRHTKQEDDAGERRVERIRGGVTGGAMGGLGGTALGAISLARGHHSPTSASHIFNKITKERGLDVKHHPGGFEHMVPPNFRRAMKDSSHPLHGFLHRSTSAHASGMGARHGTVFVHPSAGPAVMAHELGHAHHMGRMGRKRLQVHGALRKYGPAAGVAGAAGMLMSDDERVQKLAPAAVLAGAAPTLYQEGRASAHAVRDLFKHMKKRPAMKGTAQLVGAFGSYALPYLGAAAGMHLAAKKKKEKKSARSK